MKLAATEFADVMIQQVTLWSISRQLLTYKKVEIPCIKKRAIQRLL